MFNPGSSGNIKSSDFSSAYSKVQKMEDANTLYLTALASSHVNTVRAAIRRVTKDL